MFKNVALIFLLLVSVSLGSLLVREKRFSQLSTTQVVELTKQTQAQREEVRVAKAAVAAQEEKQRQAAATAQAEKQARREAREAAAIAAAQADSTPDPAADATATAGPKKKDKGLNAFTGSLAKMMKDPAMKNMMRTTQGAALKQVYSDFVKQHNFTPEQTEAFYNALLDKQAGDMEKGMKMFDKGVDASAAAADTGDPDAKIKAALGDDLYPQYKDYEKTLVGRYTLSHYQQQLAANNTTPLNSDQSRAMLQAVNEEKINFPGGLKDAMGNDGAGMMTDPTKVDQFVKAQEDLNRRIDARVEYVLTPDQLKVLKDQQQQMITMQRMGMEMAAKMMAPAPTP